jgi:CubicO group peptidase (beta-lactamase class C family)
LHDGLRVANPAALGLDTARLSRIADVLRGDLAPKTTSVLIVYRGRLVYELYAEPGQRELLNNTRSATKSITSLAVGAAIADGKLRSVSQPLFSLLADMRPFAHDDSLKEAITLRDALTMSSALACNDDEDKSPGNENNMHDTRAWTRWAVDLPSDSAYRRDSTGLGPWRYCTTNAVLLGQAVQRAVGERVDHYVERRLLRPLGISQWEWQYSPSGEVMTGGGLGLRSRDLAKLAMLVGNGGAWNGAQVLPSAWISAATGTYRQAYGGALGYGYLFWHQKYRTACESSEGTFMAGNGGNVILTIPDLDAQIVVTRQNYNRPRTAQQTAQLLEDYILPAIPCGRAASGRDSAERQIRYRARSKARGKAGSKGVL